MSKRKMKVVLILLTIILGILLSIQLKLSKLGYRYVEIQDIEVLQNTIVRENAELKQLQELEITLLEREQKYSNAKNTNGDFEEILKKELSSLKIFGGYTGLEGEGVVIIISDAKRDIREMEELNDLIVHDYDIRAIISDLRNNGAEAISINDQRIIFNKTDLYCTGPTIRINDQVFAQPFIIKAIGDPVELEEVMLGSGGYANILEQVGIFIELNTSQYVQIPKYVEYQKPKYMKKEGEK